MLFNSVGISYCDSVLSFARNVVLYSSIISDSIELIVNHRRMGDFIVITELNNHTQQLSNYNGYRNGQILEILDPRLFVDICFLTSFNICMNC